MNEFVEAAENSTSDEDSEDRYNKLKKEEAGTENTDPAKQRYNELKEKAKKDYEKQQKKRKMKEDSDDEEEDKEFITY